MAWEPGKVETYLTREQLYALVWAEPVRTIAQQLGISDVALAKTCRKHDVPVPSRGYWAKLEAGKPVERFRLHPSDLYTHNYIRLWSNPEVGMAERAKALAAELPVASVEELRDRLAARLGKVTAPATFRDAHRAIRALVDRDEALRRDPNGWRTPVFGSPYQQRRLRILNGLFLGMAKVRGVGRISGYEGSTIRLEIGPHHLDATLGIARRRGAEKFAPVWSRDANPERLVFAIETRDMRIDAATSWRDEDDIPLESQLTEIVIGLGVAAETMHREGRRLHQEWLVQHEAEKIEAARKRKIEEERRLRQEREAAEKARHDALLRDAEDLGKAERLRAYVDFVLASPPAGISREALAEWGGYVRRQADRIDPRTSGRLVASINEACRAQSQATEVE